MSLQLHSSDSPNYAPINPLLQNMQEQAQDRSIEIDPEKWFDEIKEKLENEEKPTWETEVLKWTMLFLFLEGNMLIKKARYGKGWRTPALPERTDLPVYGNNYAGFYSEALKALWTASNTDIRWRPMRDTDDSQGAAKGAQHVRNHLKQRLDTNEFKQTEALLAQCGKYVRYSYYTDKQKSYARRQKFETRQLQFGESSYLCPDCGAGGIYDNAGAVQGSQDEFGNPQIAGFGGSSAAMQQGAPIDNGAAPQMPTGGARNLPQSGQPLALQGELNGQPGAMVQPGTVYPGNDAMGFGPLSREVPGNAFAADPTGGLRTDFVGDAGQGAASDSALFGGGSLSNLQDVPIDSICPECGFPNIAVEYAEPFEVDVPTGYEYIETGSIVREPVPVFELKHETNKSPQKSNYLIRSRRCRVDELQYEFPDLKISSANGDDLGLKLEEMLRRSVTGSGRGKTGGEHETETTDFIQIWLTPCMYANRRLKADLVTRAGETIPAGTVLGQKFKKGLYMAFIQGVKGVVELRDECHADYWVGGVLRQRAISSFGSGIEGLVQANMQLNLTDSIIFEMLRTSAMPATLIDERLLPNGLSAYIGSLANVPVDLSALDDRRRLQDAVHQLSPQPPSQSHFAYGEKINNFLQMESRVMQFGAAAPGGANETATSAEIVQSTTQQLLGPQLANKADVEKGSAEVELQLWKVYCHDEVYISLQGRRGEQDGIWLSAANINVDLYAEVVPDSWLPQTNLERRQRWDAFLQRVGGLQGLKQALEQFPAQVEQIAEIFDVDLAGDDYSAAAELCRERIDQMIAAAPMVAVMQQGMPTVQMAADPMTGKMVPVPVDPVAEAGKFLVSILDPQPDIEQLGHMGSIHYLREWLGTDERRKVPPEVAAGVKALIYFHLDGLMAEAQFTGLLGAMGQPPQPMPAGQESEKPKGGGKPNLNGAPEMKQRGKEAAMAGAGA